MLRGERVGLRARQDGDVPILYEELYGDVQVYLEANEYPWTPRPPGRPDSPFAIAETKPDVAVFSVVELATNTLAGSAALWGIDTHNRIAHIGITMRPAFRGLGLGRESVALLCHYGFVIRGLHRLQIETLARNNAMVRVAEQLGFIREGVLRGSAYLAGERLDEVILGQLASEWRSR